KIAAPTKVSEMKVTNTIDTTIDTLRLRPCPTSEKIKPRFMRSPPSAQSLLRRRHPPETRHPPVNPQILRHCHSVAAQIPTSLSAQWPAPPRPKVSAAVRGEQRVPRKHHRSLRPSTERP